jgi:F-type H+-transporting ATPase subunit b
LRDFIFAPRFFAARVSGFVALAVLAAGLSCTPIRLAAQEATPAAKSEAATDAPAKKTQEEQENVFRLEGPVVKWTAKALNLPVTTTANLFDIINFAILALLIGVPLVKVLPKILRKRTETLSSSIETARKATADANARLSAIEAQLSGLDAEIAKIRAQVEEESKADEVRIKSTIEEESARIVAAAEQEITSAAAQATRTLRHFAADLAIEQATAQLNLTPEADRALIAEFAGSVAKGGQN